MKDPIVQIGNPVLSKVAKPVLKKDFGGRALATLVEKMKHVLQTEEFGVALAAPQVGSSLRLFVVSEKVFENTPPKRASQKVLGGPRFADKREDANLAPDHFARHVLASTNTVFINP